MSVEQKIRERLDKLALAAAIWGVNTKEPKPSIDEAAQAILQIIESDVIEENKLSVSKPLEMPESLWLYYTAQDDLRAEQRANLREDK